MIEAGLLNFGITAISLICGITIFLVSILVILIFVILKSEKKDQEVNNKSNVKNYYLNDQKEIE